MSTRYCLIILFCLLSTFISTTNSMAREDANQIVAGAGPSTRVVELFFQEVSKQPFAKDYSFTVPRKSSKHKGGIDNSDNHLFGRTGRPLTPSELALNKGEIYLAMVPTVIVGGAGVTVPSLSMSELERIYRKQITNWKAVGGPDAPITTVGREASEAIFSEIKKYYFFFRQATFDETFIHDHDVISFLRTPSGRYAIAFGAAPNFWGMNIISIKERLQAGVRVGLVYDLKNSDHPLLRAIQEYAASDEWRNTVEKSPLGLTPVLLPEMLLSSQ